MLSKVKDLLLKGVLLENPVLRLIIGVCPTLAVTTKATNGLGMGLAATFVLICSNTVISALRNVIPTKVRIPAYITIIATFVTLVQMVVEAYLPDLNAALGIFLPLIVVNCIILGRAEMFASKNTVLLSAVDGFAMGAGFTVTLVLMAGIRELLGTGKLFDIVITADLIEPMGIFIAPAGGFFVYGILIALALQLEKIPFFGPAPKHPGCVGCPSESGCMAFDREDGLHTALSENDSTIIHSVVPVATTPEQADNQDYNAEQSENDPEKQQETATEQPSQEDLSSCESEEKQKEAEPKLEAEKPKETKISEPETEKTQAAKPAKKNKSKSSKKEKAEKVSTDTATKTSEEKTDDETVEAKE